MRFLLSVLCSLVMCSQMWAQNEALAQQYYEKGEYKKAVVAYEKLYKQSPRKVNYFIGMINSHQQLEDFETAEKLLLESLQQPKFNPILLVETGSNYDLKKDSINANSYYEKAVSYTQQKISSSYSIGRAFEKKSLLDYALRVYKSAMEQTSLVFMEKRETLKKCFLAIWIWCVSAKNKKVMHSELSVSFYETIPMTKTTDFFESCF